MTGAIVSPAHLARFAELVGARLGFAIDDDRVASALAACIAITHDTPAVYLDRLAAPSDTAALHALIGELTVGETYFFRHREQLDAFVECVVAKQLAARVANRQLTVLSAGCSSGEEAYSLAILLHDRLRDAGWQLVIDAVDINPSALARARRGVYSKWALRQTPPAVVARWFTRTDETFVLDPAIVRAVRFSERNLAGEAGWPTARYDAVFCRNVLMYFTPVQAAASLARVVRSLVSGGYLFLGHAESLHGRSEVLALRQSHGTFYYQVPCDGDTRTAAASWTLPELVSDASAGGRAGADHWTDAIRSSADRVAALTTAPPPAAMAPADGPALAVAAARAAVAAERYGDALAELDALPAAEAAAPAALLLRAIALFQRGELATAAAACGALLAGAAPTGDAAGAHYLLALGRERGGDLVGAVEHDALALALDPQFVMARIQLARIARRAGDRVTASRELTRAIELLAIDDAADLGLYGGGFGRGALLELCRAELRAAQGAAG